MHFWKEGSDLENLFAGQNSLLSSNLLAHKKQQKAKRAYRANTCKIFKENTAEIRPALFLS